MPISNAYRFNNINIFQILNNISHPVRVNQNTYNGGGIL